MQLTIERKYLAPKEVARIVGVREATVQRWIRTKKMPAIQVGRKFFVRKDFEQHLSTLRDIDKEER